MKLKEKMNLNLILGIFLGLIPGLFLFLQGKLILMYLEEEGYHGNHQWIFWICTILAVLAGALVIRRFLSIKKKRLTMYFIGSVIVSVFFVFLLMYVSLAVVGSFFQYEEVMHFFRSKIGGILGVDLGYLYIMILIGAFVALFMTFVNRKVKYIEYISEEVKKIEIEGFGRTMEVRGADELTDLSKGINTMSTTLKEKMDREKQLEKNKNELITNVSHDLRTPLTSIMGYVALMKQNGFEDKEKCTEYLDVVDRRLQGLNALINELFEYTRLDSSEFLLNISKVELMEILNHLVKEYAIIYQKAGLQMDVQQIELESCMVNVDVEKIVRVFQNLLDNARKYAREGSTVEIQVDEAEQRLRIRISNETDQLRAEEMNRIFERFYKGDTARSKPDSFGLGLAIVKRIVELHDGDIQGELDNGRVCFTVELPVA